MSTILLKGGNIVIPGIDKGSVEDIYVKDGIIYKIGGPVNQEPDRIFDCSGMMVTCGLVDMHVHLRDPGQEHKEDIISGSRAAAHGGVTSIMAMPNTLPPMDSVQGLSYVKDKGANAAAHIYQAASVTKGMLGNELCDMSDLAAAGAVAFSEDGKSVLNENLLEEGMREAAKLGLPMLSHCEDPSLVRGGVMNLDENSKRLNLPGICNESEEVIVARDIELCKKTGCHLHICHCSTKGSVELIRKAKKEGVNVSAETCPHYLILTSDNIPCDNGNFKMNPPLRSAKDREALIEGIKDGTIDVISTDHAPHTPEEKSHGFKGSPFGIVGLETSFALIYTYFVKTRILTPGQMMKLMAQHPAGILGINAGNLKEGMPADLAVFDTANEYVINPEAFLSKGRNTPFAGNKVSGKTMLTLCGGNIVWEDRLWSED